jgi:hypothetical protein
MRCKDCGASEYEPSTRADVCKPCMENRLKLVKGAEAGQISVEELKAVQRTMATDIFRHGRAKRKISKLLDESGAGSANLDEDDLHF